LKTRLKNRRLYLRYEIEAGERNGDSRRSGSGVNNDNISFMLRYKLERNKYFLLFLPTKNNH